MNNGEGPAGKLPDGSSSGKLFDFEMRESRNEHLENYNISKEISTENKNNDENMDNNVIEKPKLLFRTNDLGTFKVIIESRSKDK
ncbi:hypothetical protein O3M35_001345 [Rhynocoris fuscipes]|uniref:Uncharacterized protein n=1 Tax=Rhynocoris fuscipes TaxID=488301 RepID=A0AAW1DPZ4_9HEMI